MPNSYVLNTVAWLIVRLPSLFAAMSVHLLMAGFLDPNAPVVKMAKNRLRTSMTAMKELSAYWPVCSWIFQLFTKIIKERSRGGNREEQGRTPISMQSGTEQPGQVYAYQGGADQGGATGNWADIEEFTASLGDTDGMDFDFSHLLDGGVDVGFLNNDTSLTPIRDSIFPRFLTPTG